MLSAWAVIKSVYFVGIFISAIITFLISRDRLRIRLFTALNIGFSWPLSLPVVLLFALF